VGRELLQSADAALAELVDEAAVSEDAVHLGRRIWSRGRAHNWVHRGPLPPKSRRYVASGSGHLVRRRVMLMAVIGPFHRFGGSARFGSSSRYEPALHWMDWASVESEHECWLGACRIAGMGGASEEVRRRIESSVSWRRTQQFTQGRAIPPGTRMDAVPVRPLCFG
jgi:hypothetical protein